MKSVNMHVSDACGEILAGSSPAVGNKKEITSVISFLICLNGEGFNLPLRVQRSVSRVRRVRRNFAKRM